MKVSVIIPFNKDRGVDRAINSVQHQTYQGEIEIVLSQSNNGVSYNLNKGIEKSTGQLIKYLCDDDELTYNSIEDSVNTIQHFDFIHGNAYNVFPTTRVEQHRPKIARPTLQEMRRLNVIHGGTLMYKREVFDKIGMFDESLTCAEEYEFNMRCLKAGLNLGYCPSFLYKYYRHDNQKSLGKGVDQVARAIKIKAIQDKFR